jgi:small ligand-binding sensory domain FIST
LLVAAVVVTEILGAVPLVRLVKVVVALAQMEELLAQSIQVAVLVVIAWYPIILVTGLLEVLE